MSRAAEAFHPIPDISALPVLEYYWPLLRDFVNKLPDAAKTDSRVDGLWVDVRNVLFDLAHGRGFVGAARPALSLRGDGCGVRFVPQRPRTFADFEQALRTALILVQGLESECVRSCARGNACGRFFLGRRALRRQRYFCSDTCRFAARERGRR